MRDDEEFWSAEMTSCFWQNIDLIEADLAAINRA